MSRFVIMCNDFSDHIVDAVIYSPFASQAKHNNKVLRVRVFNQHNANICHTPGSPLQSNAPRQLDMLQRAETKQPRRARAMFAMFTTRRRRTHSLFQRGYIHIHSCSYTIMDASTVTEPLVTPFWGLSVVQVINTDLHIVFLFVFLCFFGCWCP